MVRLAAVSEPRGPAYGLLVTHAREKGCEGLVVVRSEMGLSERGETVLDRLGPSIRSDAQAKE